MSFLWRSVALRRKSELYQMHAMAYEAFHVNGTRALFVSHNRLRSQAAYVRFLNYIDGIGYPHESHNCLTTFPNGSTVKFESVEERGLRGQS